MPTHMDSALSLAVLNAAYAGIPAAGDSATIFVLPGGDDGNDGTTWKKAKATIAAAVIALPASGGVIQLGYGTHSETATVTLDRPVSLRGVGVTQPEDPSTDPPTKVTFPAGVAGIVMGSRSCAVEDMALLGAAVVAGSDHGITVGGYRPVLRNLDVSGFGGDGVHFDTTKVNNAHTLINVRAYNNKGNGFSTGGTDSNVGTWLACTATSNGGYGFYSDGATNTFINMHAASNAGGDYYEAGGSNVWINPYSEGGGSFTIDAAARYGVIEATNFGAPVFTNNAPGGGAFIIHKGGDTVQRFGIVDRATGTVGFDLTSGEYGAQYLNLNDRQAGGAGSIWRYQAALRTFYLGQKTAADKAVILKRTTATLAAAGSVTIDASTTNAHDVTLGANATSSSITNPSTGQVLTLTWRQDATGGRTYTWPTTCRFAGGTAPSDTTASTTTSVTFVYDGSTWRETARAGAVPV